jgi:hypothetical protein
VRDGRDLFSRALDNGRFCARGRAQPGGSAPGDRLLKIVVFFFATQHSGGTISLMHPANHLE